MTRKNLLLLMFVAIIATACAEPAPPPPLVVPEGEDRFLIDPRGGFAAEVPPAVERRFETAWRHLLAGNDVEARRRLEDLLGRNPDYAPAALALAAIDIREGRLDAAAQAISAIRQRFPDLTAVRVYEAEIALRQGQTRAAYEVYRELAAEPDAPETARQRLAQLEESQFNELFTAARAAEGQEAIRLLREALEFSPDAVDARVLLSRRLLEQRAFEEARRELDPLLNTSADRADVQELLAEIDVGRGRYEEAIVRYDRLARRTNDPRFQRRLEEVKQEWSAANMPPQYRRAFESESLTRAELATLLYWTVPSVRFAQNLRTPPIATDLTAVEGRDEIIRSIALGLYEVDPITRRVSPHRTVTALRLSEYLARVLMLRGAACAAGQPQDEVLGACGVDDPLTSFAGDATITGREAARFLEQVARTLR